ncbi:MAG: hypothetical protein ABI182_06570 [Candidatus Baltobacteraceae bacterium]
MTNKGGLISTVLLFTLAACGGGGASVPAGSAGGNAVFSGAFTLAFLQPPALKASPLFVSPSASSVSITVNGGAQTIADVSSSSPNCTGPGATRTCTIHFSAPAGSDVFVIQLFQGPSGTGNVLGTSSVTQAVSSNGFIIAATVNGVIASVQISAANLTFTSGIPGATTITAIAKDAGGNVIIGGYTSAITLTDSGTTGAITVTPLTLASSSQTATATYDGSTSITSATISATVPTVPPGNIQAVTLSVIAAPFTITEFSNGITPGATPNQITTGGDRNLWFSEQNRDRIARITPVGVVTEFQIPTANAIPLGVAKGSDGNIWFTEQNGGPLGNGAIGRITPAGTFIEYSAGISPGAAPTGITSGPDGNLWFTELLTDQIGRITTAGVITEFGGGISPGAQPFRITTGADNNLWFSEQAIDRIARITTAGVVTEFSAGITPGAQPRGITAGPDGNLWFSEQLIDRVARITTAGAVTEFSTGITPGAGPNSITSGPDGNLWFSEPLGNRIGRITTAGVVTEFSRGLSAGAKPQGITSGPDGNIWFTEASIDRIGRLQL